ncbi:MAG: aldo/keto reductase [Chloroflexota bacterium]
MQYKLLGKTGVQISQFGFGTMLFGGEANEKASQALFERCREVGINFFDCANIYMDGRSEEILGKLIYDCRDEIILTTKGYGPIGSDINAKGSSRLYLRRAIEGSLRRLNTDYIDLYFLHNFDNKTPIEETLRALDDLVAQGKILYIGASNFAAWQVAKALGVSAKEGLARFECIQPMYNLAKRQAEVELLPMALSEQVGVVPYNPLGGGLLTGKYGVERRPDNGRLLKVDMYKLRYGDPIMYEIAERFTSFAQERGYDPVGLAVAWVAAHPAVTSPILGARNVQQLEGSLKALDIDMTPDLYAEISALSPTPPPATDRSEERIGPKF